MCAIIFRLTLREINTEVWKFSLSAKLEWIHFWSTIYQGSERICAPKSLDMIDCPTVDFVVSVNMFS